MIITPSTVVKILKGVNTDNTYRNTYSFKTIDEQTAFFTTKKKFEFYDFSYQRVNGTIKINVNAENLFDCDYLMFRNESIRNKWFYAFITKIDFINQNCTEISFEVDVMQTWYFDYVLQNSFVEREHVNSDNFGEHLTAENVETGEYIYNTGVVNTPSTLCDFTPIIIMGVSELLEEDKTVTTGNILDNVFTGLKYFWCSTLAVDRMEEKIKKYSLAGKGAAIVTIFMFPKELLSLDHITGSGWITDELSQPIKGGNIINLFAPIDGYTPKNKKLYSYPFRCFEISTGTNAKTYQYEYFNNFSEMFNIIGTPSPSANIIAVPLQYKGININLDENITLSPFPQCSWINDTYANWLAQNQMSNALTLVSGAATVFSGGAQIVTGNTGRGINSIVSGAAQIAERVAKSIDYSVIPDSAKGSTASNNTFFSNGQWYFYLIPKCIRREYAEKIDNYFTLYGYKINNVKKPNITGRKSWNYVKTISANVIGSLPVDDLSKIREVFDNGVTFWHGDFLGDYSQDNNIIGG